MTKAQRAEAEADACATAIASAARNPDGRIAAPALFADKRMRAAAEVWNRLLPHLQQTNLWRDAFFHTFAFYCDNVAQAWAARREMMVKGLEYTTPTGFVRERPCVARYERLTKAISDQAKNWALTPLDYHNLMRLQAGYPGGELPSAPAQPATAPPTGEGDDDLIGLASRMAAAPTTATPQ